MDDFERLGSELPCLLNLQPSGDQYLMEDFCYAGGLPVIMKEILNTLLHANDIVTVTGKTVSREHRREAEELRPPTSSKLLSRTFQGKSRHRDA